VAIATLKLALEPETAPIVPSAPPAVRPQPRPYFPVLFPTFAHLGIPYPPPTMMGRPVMVPPPFPVVRGPVMPFQAAPPLPAPAPARPAVVRTTQSVPEPHVQSAPKAQPQASNAPSPAPGPVSTPAPLVEVKLASGDEWTTVKKSKGRKGK
jgi:hypothetical protein